MKNRNKALTDYEKAVDPNSDKHWNKVDIYDYSKPFVSMQEKYNKRNLNEKISRNFRDKFNPIILGKEFYFTEQILQMKKPNQYPFLKYTFDSSVRANDSELNSIKGLPVDVNPLMLDYYNERIYERFQTTQGTSSPNPSK